MKRITISIFVLLSLFSCSEKKIEVDQRPNILFCIADDASFPHMGAYGTNWVKTPAFDRVAKEGLLFMNAYTPNAKCAPSRSAILTGRNSWQLEEAANHWNNFPLKFKSYVEALGENGYTTGFTGKGWGPGKAVSASGIPRELTGKAYKDKTINPPTTKISRNDYSANFEVFLDSASTNTPWCFWYGGYEPHRAYEYGTGIGKGKKELSDITEVPAFWPDNEMVRTDMLDYAYEVEYFDFHLEKIIATLEANGQLENTIIVVTADNGMPFPRIKGQEYELSNHLPLAIMWPKGIKNPGRIVQEYVSFIDFAPTFIEIAGLEWEKTQMAPTPGKSLTDVFGDSKSNTDRDFVVFGKERHDVGRPKDQGYPIRGIVKEEYLYVKNFEPTRWPAGNPETGYLNTDGSPTKTVILDLRRNGENAEYWQMNFGKRPEEELYQIGKDPLCMDNLADMDEMKSIKTELSELLFTTLETQQDPRVLGNGEVFESYPYIGKESNFYERFMNGEEMNTGWVNDTDFEKEKLD
ncbi:sulfatase family protein [Ulvibacterium marinum]|uniref:Heparan N-sulfatase n=1 Tax=Ulvibacterium marinum TaxID=2419782 RepID=A0A3B0C8H0_9FLAO|nr:sulfatase [Ulvibacterium marinum]RKN80861.1 heparan N-sulfatase [Ulvibacterium marinum]